MAEVGSTTGVVGVADVGFILAAKLFTFGTIIASADGSIIAIAKAVALVRRD